MTLSQRITGFKKLKFDYWYFFFLVLAFGQGTAIVSTFDPRSQPLSFIVLMVATIALFRKTKDRYQFSNIFLLVNMVSLAWTGYHYFADTGGFDYGTYIMQIIYINVGIVVAVHYKEELFTYYPKVVATLTFLGFFFWLLGSVIGYVNLLKIAPFEHKWGNGGSFLFYVITTGYHNSSTLQDATMYGSFIRNCGFCWEPGRFASLLLLAIVVKMVRDENFRWLSSQCVVLLLGLITTFSTTGYLSFLVVIILYYLFSSQTSFVNKIVMLAILFASVSCIMSLPFMEEKILQDTDESEWVSNNAGATNWVDREDNIFTVGRSEGMALDLLNIQYKPIGGCGLSHKETYVYENISQNLGTSNGLFNPLSKLGLLLGLLWFYILLRGSMYQSNPNGDRRSNQFLFFISLLLISYSYNFIFDIFIIAVAASYFVNKETNYESIGNRR